MSEGKLKLKKMVAEQAHLINQLHKGLVQTQARINQLEHQAKTHWNITQVLLEMLGRTGKLEKWRGWATEDQRAELFKLCGDDLAKEAKEAQGGTDEGEAEEEA